VGPFLRHSVDLDCELLHPHHALSLR